MPKRKMKLTPEKRVELVESYLNGEDSMTSLARTADISWAALRNWIMLYENGGPTGLLARRKNTHYTIETKIQAVNDYLNGLGSLSEITKKYGLRQSKQLRDWIKIYN
ncbi:transposase, partial [Enterococcus faecium]|nr:transposase [Enterococcus faecium]